MNLFNLLKYSDKKPLLKLLGLASGSALSTTVVVAIAAYAAKNINESQESFVDVPLALMFIVSLLIYFWTESKMIARLAREFEDAIHELRMKLILRIRHADLWKLEHFGQIRLYESITQNSKTISSNSQYIAQAVRSVILLVMLLIYIAFISTTAFFILLAMLLVAAKMYHSMGKSMEQTQVELTEDEGKLFDYVSDLFDGFKEQRLCSIRSQTLGREFAEQSQSTVSAQSLVYQKTWQQFVFGETTFNIMLGVVLFVVPAYSPSVSDELVKISSAVLFMGTPIFGLMQSLAVLRAVEAAAGRMLVLETELEDIEEKNSVGEQAQVNNDFSEISMKGVEFEFPAQGGEIPFSVGPIDLSIKRGEIIFISGGNGSGKSTFIKLLTGLYKPHKGKLKLDGVYIDAARLSGYRMLIAPVFSDFHLFPKLYGLSENDMIDGNDLLNWMEMENTSTLENGQFSRINLSSGQRKRLALTAAILESKPILILDEWAADQDTYFRKKFYREVLPELQRRGLTIIAVTHDDRYFNVADRRLHFEEGKMTELKHSASKKGGSNETI